MLAPRRARARADRAARDSGHAARGLRPRRLERLAPARRPRARRAPVQRVDGHAPSPDARRRSRRRCGAPAAPALADALEARAAAGSATTSSACSSRTASWPGLAHFRGDGADRALAAPARPRDRRRLQPAADDPRDPRRPVHARAGAAPRRGDPAPPARGRRRAPVRPAAAVPRRRPAPLPARGDRHVLRPRDRAHVHARAPALCGGDGAPRRGRGVLHGAAPGESGRPARPSCRTRGRARRTATRRAPTRRFRTATRPPRATTR